MSTSKSTNNTQILPTISRKDFPDEFDEFKGVTDYYLHVRIEFLKTDHPVPEFWAISDLVTGVPYYLENESDHILKHFDQRIHNILSKLEIQDSVLGQLLSKRLQDLTSSILKRRRLTSKDVDFADLPWGIMPCPKKTNGIQPIQSDSSGKMADMSRGSIGLVFTAMLQAGFTKDKKPTYYYPLLTMMTGHSPGGWNKAIAKDLPTLIKRGDDISKLDLENVKNFLSETLKSIEGIKPGVRKSRRIK